MSDEISNSYSKKPLLMGILNVTPDSFSDGGKYSSLDPALARVETMLAEGADIVDMGGESTRPGAEPVSEQEEMDRVLPVFEAVKERFDVAVSVDTSNESLMRAVLPQVDIVNDVRALGRLDDLSFLAEASCQICLMHMQGDPKTMQNSPQYDDVVETVSAYLATRIETCVAQGIDRSRLIADPGFGFGKTLEHNLRVLNQLEAFAELKCPILVGTSRKSMIGQVLGTEIDERVFGSIATIVMAIQKGAAYLRVHDIAASRQAMDMTWAVLTEGKN